MSSTAGIVLCLGYILGLLLTKIAWGGGIVLLLGIVLAAIVPRCWRTAPSFKIWLAAGFIGLVATLHFQLRIPQPQTSDISQLITADTAATAWVVRGTITSLPHVTRSQKAQFWLNVQQATPNQGHPVTGRLYVTVPLLQATGLHPGQTVNVMGSLYLPKPATNPGAFDFKEYLKQAESFAGLAGKQVERLNQSAAWGWWMAQQQIVRSQILWLGSPVGPLVSAMVLGKVIDLPPDIKDQFTHVGLAAALAASGFQTSLILGVVLSLTRRCSNRVKVTIGTIALVGFVGLTGLQPSILRAAVMGFGGLVALLMERTLKPFGALLVTATLLLLYQPNWIWDLGFELSFLATLGLLVTVPPLTKWLDWLPTAIAPLITVPIAAYLWTLPLQLFAIGVLSPYSIPVNIITTPLISVISIGGMASALAALIWSPAGSGLAWLLYYPTQALIAIVDFFAQLPGNAYATGTISSLITIALYGLVAIVWWHPWWHRRWWIALFLGVVLTLIPLWQSKSTLFRATVLATSSQPVMVIQEAGRTALVNAGDAAAANFTVLPFLQKQGVNQLDWTVLFDAKAPFSTAASNSQNGWSQILERLPAKLVYSALRSPVNSTRSATRGETIVPLPTEQGAKIGASTVQLISSHPAVVQFQLRDQTWLWLGSLSEEQQMQFARKRFLQPVQVLWWSGKSLSPALLAGLKPEVAIASTNIVNSETIAQLQQHHIRLFWTGRDGAIEWTPTTGFRTTLESDDNDPSHL